MVCRQLAAVPGSRAFFAPVNHNVPVTWALHESNCSFEVCELPADARCGFHGIAASQIGYLAWKKLDLKRKICLAREAAEKASGAVNVDEKINTKAGETWGFALCSSVGTWFEQFCWYRACSLFDVFLVEVLWARSDCVEVFRHPPDRFRICQSQVLYRPISEGFGYKMLQKMGWKDLMFCFAAP